MKMRYFGQIFVIGLLILFVGVSFGASFDPLSCDANGPYEGNIMDDIEFDGTATGGIPPYEFFWDYGEGNTSSGDPHPTHNYANAGNYTVILTVTDSENNTASDSTWAHINAPPTQPDINGPTYGKAGVPQTYTFISTDPDGDDILYSIDWGCGDSETTDFFPSDEPVKVSHTYVSGKFVISVIAIDINQAESDPSTLEITMPRNKVIYSPFLQFLQTHPNLFPILRYILSL